jgi:hypothetical protein
MKNKILIIISIFALNIAFGQNSANLDLVKRWKLTKGWFPEQNIEFTKTNSYKSNYSFEFKNDGEINYLGSLDGMSCQVGAFTMKDGNWKIKGHILTLELRELKISDYWYWWVIKYNLTVEGDKLKLEVLQIIKNREISPTKTWEELINE